MSIGKVILVNKESFFGQSRIFLGVVLLIETAIIIFSQTGKLPAPVDVPATFGTPLAIGQELFTNYLLPFEATSILLLTALVGAIVLTRGEKK